MRTEIISLPRIFLSCILLSLSLHTTYANTAEELPIECKTDCATPYGEVLGVSPGGINAYSNCQDSCVNPERNTWKNTYTGIKWQCVEYARRWLLVNKGAVYDDVDTAADIWNEIDHLTDVESNRSLPLESRLNGSEHAPQVGDLLIYASAFHGTGHVAVVTDVDIANGFIEVGEQNYNNEPWPADFARKIHLFKTNNNYWLIDESLIGWKHLTNTATTRSVSTVYADGR